jgi:hypothetical protein
MVIRIEHWIDDERKFELVVTTSNNDSHSIASDNPELQEIIVQSIQRALTIHFLAEKLNKESK